ncbi:Peptidase family M23 [Salinimicrobium catena]|uniref:Peptidase family M23 n=1 Tax=Salinimicrobium catena TaxID=390640 RepID=A0A1H5NC24_9FLAO|nr:peptidoglycan DD-metalloendopeptidase family protein [Salinimicrobium catena]SDL42690.1 Peptidase family M23 [Salinimicrobium catena]SEE99192.1 Peptidase family M23 [Salinimicrobium catena]
MQEKTFSELLTGLTSDFTPVVDAGFSVSDYTPIDLSVKNKDLSEKELSSAEAFSEYLSKYLQKKGKKVAWRGYNELRELYQRSGLFSAEEDPELKRNIHLGIDVWAAAGTDVLAVLDGTVHSFRDNDNFGDYGPTIILKHEIKNQKFYSLYGHLSRSSLAGLKERDQVVKGEKIGELGAASENGDYAPHLHFQLIRDLQGQKGDFPGVTSRRFLAEYLQDCPDPNLLLKIPG